jgi:hypothetical protein
MANTDGPNGFKFAYRVGGGTPSMNTFPVDVSNATAIFQGDLITAEADGNVKPSAANDGVSVIGVAAGLLDANKKPILYLPATTVGYVIVNTDPKSVFEVQADSGTAVTEGDRFATANHSAGAGSVVTGRSGHELDSSDIGTGLQMRIIDKIQTPDNAWAEHVNLEVMLVEHALADATSI